jgi:hypothetical protein
MIVLMQLAARRCLALSMQLCSRAVTVQYAEIGLENIQSLAGLTFDRELTGIGRR